MENNFSDPQSHWPRGGGYARGHYVDSQGLLLSTNKNEELDKNSKVIGNLHVILTMSSSIPDSVS